MKNFRLLSLLLVVSVLQFISAKAAVRLPSIYSSHMVLQQNSKMTFWGWAAPSESIEIQFSWNGKTEKVTATRDAKWQIQINTPAAGGPFTISFKASNTIVLEDVMIGEVWLCSGQSNMEWSSLNGNKQAIEEVPQANNPNIRLFNVPKTTANYPQDDCYASWKTCTPEEMKSFSAVGYFFGKKLQKDLNVPIGLINASWGGTAAEVWTPAPVIEQSVEFKQALALSGATPWWPIDAGKAYNAMIAPLTQYTIAGALWYQGESNTSKAESYSRLFTDMIKSWRKAWDIDFPFYYVQIAPFTYGTPFEGALLREAQTKSMWLPKTGMVVISDLVDNIQDIHPQNKVDVATRLANWALAETYGKKSIIYRSPQYKAMRVEGTRIVVQFDFAPSGLISKNGAITGFEVAGDDRQFYPATAVIEGSNVILTCPQVKVPAAIRFGFSNTSMPNLFSKEGLPVDMFRTDGWPVK